MRIINIRRHLPQSTLLLAMGLYARTTANGQAAPFAQWQEAVGRWTLISIYPTDNVEGPSLSEQKQLLGTTLDISPGMLKSCSKSVPVTSVQFSRKSPDDFLFNTRVRFRQVGIKTSSVTEITLNNNDGQACFGAFPLPGQDIYLKAKDELLVDFAGVFYRAIRKN